MTASTALVASLRSTATRDGLRDMMPGAVGVIPFATMIGVAVGASPMDPVGGWISGLVVAGGAAHLALTASVTIGTGFIATVVTALLINARTLIYGALVAPKLSTQPRWFRWTAAYALVDQSYALLSALDDRDDGYVRSYYLAGTALLWTAYMSGTGLGIALGPVIPTSVPLALAIPIMFLAMALPALTSTPARVAGGVGLAMGVLCAGLPAGIGMIVAIVTGTAAGAIAEGRSDA